MEKIGFIGVGNMGGALAQVAAKAVGPEHLLVSNRTLEKAQVFAAGLGAAAVSNAEVAAQAEMIFLGVKPQKMAGVLEELKSILAARQDRFVLVSMAAGLTTNQISAMAGRASWIPAKNPTPRATMAKMARNRPRVCSSSRLLFFLHAEPAITIRSPPQAPHARSA